MNLPAAFLLLLVVVCLTGCARSRYHPVPVSPPAIAQSLEARSLDDPGLRDWMRSREENAAWPLQEWDLQQLTLAAFYFSPDLDVARANAATADAAIVTAAAKPNPSVTFGPGYETPNPAQFITSFDFSLPVETAGKRGYRIAAATHLSEASKLQLGETAWLVRSRVRTALADYLFALKTTESLQREQYARDAYVGLIERRFRAGEISQPEVTAARIDQVALRQTMSAAVGQVHTSRVALATAIGIPETGLAGKTFLWPELETPPTAASLSVKALRGAAVRNRLEVQRALAQYEAAQATLQLEVARQYPDINLGPAYAFEEGSNFISLSLSSVLPIRNRNEGPIAEAEAQRKVAGAQVLAVQSTILGETDHALSGYEAAWAVAAEARHTVEQLKMEQNSADRLLAAGESDGLSAVSAELQTYVAERARLDALHTAQLALGSLEDALQRPISPAIYQPLPQSAPR